jgi:hypothetical protein
MPDPIHTEFASRAIDVAKLFALFVTSTPTVAIDGKTIGVDLTTPHGPSTGGGAQSLQHITLVQQDRFFVIGSLDPVRHTIEFRSLNYAASLYQQRYKEPLPLGKDMYDALLQRVNKFASSQQFALTVKDVEEAKPVAPSVAPSSSKSSSLVVALSVALALALGAVAYLALR